MALRCDLERVSEPRSSKGIRQFQPPPSVKNRISGRTEGLFSRLGRVGSGAVIRNAAGGHQTVPDEQNNDCADCCSNKPSTLIGAIPTNCLTNKGRQKRSSDAEHGGDDKTHRLVWTWHDQARDEPGNKADQNDPEDTHCCAPYVNWSNLRR